MKKWLFPIVFFALSHGLMGQQWSIQLEEERTGWLYDLIHVDEGEHIVGIGRHNTAVSNCYDGLVIKADKEGNILSRVIHLPSKTLEYYSAVQLPNGNYMAFGVCDDSLCDHNFQKYIRIDVFDEQLDTVLSRTYCVDDEIFDNFSYPHEGQIMKSIVTHSGTVILATRLSYYDETWNFYAPALRIYELDETGMILRMHDTPLLQIGSINEITYIPDTDNLMILLDGGVFGYNSGVVGWYTIDTELNIIDQQMMVHLNGVDDIEDIACEGYWIDGQYLIVDGEQYEGSHFTYHTLFKMDASMNITATLPLPPYDSFTWLPYGTNTAYANDSTIFAVSYCRETMSSDIVCQTNIMLVDKNLNLLGRKVLKEDNVLKFVRPPATFNDDGCLIMVYSRNGSQYPGEPFARYELMKFRREDIEITWDVVNETAAKPTNVAYPNPAANSINIPINETLSNDARIQLIDAKGAKCLDSEVGNTGYPIKLDVHNFDIGLYVYKVMSGKREITSGKFIKE